MNKKIKALEGRIKQLEEETKEELYDYLDFYELAWNDPRRLVRVVRDNPMRTVKDVMDVYTCACGNRAVFNHNPQFDKIREWADEVLHYYGQSAMREAGSAEVRNEVPNLINDYKQRLEELLGGGEND